MGASLDSTEMKTVLLFLGCLGQLLLKLVHLGFKLW